MNTYRLNNIDLGSLGFIAGKQNGSNIALTGCFDMPARTGKTFHSWGAEHGIEPYVSAAEISFGGRVISLVGYIYGAGKLDCTNKANRIFELIDSFSDLVPLSCKWGTYQVYINQPIAGEFIGDKALKMTFSFFEPIAVMNGIMPSWTNAEHGIDGISFKDLGGVLLSSVGDRANRPSPKGLNFTSKTDGLAGIKTEVREITLKIFIDQPDPVAFQAKINGLYALFSAPGLRKLNMPTDLNRQFFVKDGFKVSNINSRPNRMTGIVECKITEGALNVSTPLPPIVDAGLDKTISIPNEEIVVTDASALARSGAVIRTVLWEFISSSSAVVPLLSGENTLTPRLYGMSEAGTYFFRLTVTDSNGLKAGSVKTITVRAAYTTFWEDTENWNDLSIWNEI
ncbi:hypothetical protein [Pedobacter sp. FW305-3-2-15-E-R2A2]|uniref:PKD domain-containing protein n=1 Tax=Pedobacter sp. FW305-3-2-15-E-R2A2 TaxID=3140251 RepID=UPI00313FEF8F